MAEIVTEYVGQNLDPDLKRKWWLEKDEDSYKVAWQIINSIENNQQFLRAAYSRYAALYSNMEFLGLSSRIFSRTALNSFFNNRLSLNVIKSCIDTATSKIASKRPKPTYLTDKGNWSQQQRAKKLSKFMEGLFNEMKIYDVGARCFTDSCIFGTSPMKIFVGDDNKIKCERVFVEELSVDEADGIYSTPRQLHQTKYIDRDTLKEMFPEYNDKIDSAASFVRNDLAHYSIANQIAVRESWHLPSTSKAGDGKHIISIENCTLFAEKWKYDYFPFVFLRWNPRIYGFYGMGLAEELVGIQLEINKILTTIQRSIHLIGVPRIWVENGSMVDTGKIQNEVASINKYTGTPPIFQVAPSLAPDVYNHLENLYRKAYEIMGISQLSAQSQKPSGLNSGIAMRTYQDIESERFQLQAQRYEQFYMEAADIIYDLCEEIKPSALISDGKHATRFNFSDCNLDRKDYVMRVFPTSLLPSTPAGKLQTVQELIQSGFIAKEDALSMLDFPDLEGFVSMATAAREDINCMIEIMIEDGEYNSPEPFMNLQMAVQMTQSAYLRARTEQVPEDKLELLRRFTEECLALQQQAMPPALPAPMGQPTGAPMAPPPAELMPTANIPQA